MKKQPEHDDTMADELLEAADQINDEDQPDWEGIAELRAAVKRGELKGNAAIADRLHMLIPANRMDAFDRVFAELTS